MIEVITIAIVFGSVIAIVAISCWFGYKEEELKTKLRLSEMEAGVAPGTYSKISKKDLRRARKMAQKHPEWQEEVMAEHERRTEAEEREELMRGIADLKARIENIDIIMNQKKEENRR